MSKEKRLGRGLAALLGGPLDSHEPSNQGATPPPPPPVPEPTLYRPEETAAVSTGFDTPSFETPDPVLPPSPALEVSEPFSPPASPPITTTSSNPIPQHESTNDTILLSVYEIDDNPFQPRREFNESEIVSLAESLKEHDMLQPILVRRVDDRYQLISGERRLRAAIQAGWNQIPARLREANDRLVAELAIVENLQRKDLNPIEKALSFQRYIQEHQCTQGDLAQRIKVDRSTIANLMRLLELPEQVRQDLGGGKITAGHARALLPLGDEKAQIEFCKKIQDEGMSVRETERQVQEKIDQEDSEPLAVVAQGKVAKKKRIRNQQIASLEQELRITLGTKIEIRQGARGRGKIIVHFSNNEEFERIREHLNVGQATQSGENVG